MLRNGLFSIGIDIATMPTFDLLRHLPVRPTFESALRANARSHGELLFERPANSPEDLRRLYNTSFDLELATSADFRMAPPGWLEVHHVLLPDCFPLESKSAIEMRLERMVHAPRNRNAINAILWKVAMPRKGKTYFIQIPSLKQLAQDLAHARDNDPHYIDALLHGHLGDCAQALADGTIKISAATAKSLLVNVSILWALQDLQVIACRLFQATIWPTAGWLEGDSIAPQTLDGLRKHAEKLAKHSRASEAFLLRQDPDYCDTGDIAQFNKDMKSLIGYANAIRVIDYSKVYARQWGFSEAEIHDESARLPEDFRKSALQIVQHGLKMADAIVKSSEQTDIRCRAYPDKKGSAAKRLHAGSFRDGIRPEAALAYAVITFIHMITDLPARIERFLRNPGEQELQCSRMKSQNITRLMYDIEELVSVYRAIYLNDSNYIPKKDLSHTQSGPHVRSFNTQMHHLRDYRRGVISNLPIHLQEDPHLTQGPLSRERLKAKIAGAAIKDALKILRREKALPPANSKESFVPLAPDPKLSPALAWRFACTRDTVRRPELTRPFSFI